MDNILATIAEYYALKLTESIEKINRKDLCSMSIVPKSLYFANLFTIEVTNANPCTFIQILIQESMYSVYSV